jgi:hypothetical protein
MEFFDILCRVSQRSKVKPKDIREKQGEKKKKVSPISNPGPFPHT